jgi:hypothetical protein
MVPYAVINGEGVTQSAGIIDHISKLTGEAVDLEENEQQWINWVDDKLVRFNLLYQLGRSNKMAFW